MLANGMQKFLDALSCCTYNGSQHTHILIEENDPAATLKKVTLKAPNGDWFSFNPDEGRKCQRIDKACRMVVMSPLLAIGAHDHHRACDTVVIVNRGDQLTIVYIDLKSGNPSRYAGQFKSTRQFVRYALGLLEELQQEKLTIADERYVIFYGGKPKPSINKKPTTPKLDKLRGSKADAACKCELPNNTSLFLKELLS